MPPIMQYFEEQRRRGGSSLLPTRVDRNGAARNHASAADPRTDAALANGLLHVAIARGLVDRDFIADRTAGFEAVRRTVASYCRIASSGSPEYPPQDR